MYASHGNNLSSVDHSCDPDINSHFRPVSAPPGFFPYLSLDLAVTSKIIPYVAIGPFTVDRSNGVPESVPSVPEHLFRMQLFRCKCPITTKSPRKAAPFEVLCRRAVDCWVENIKPERIPQNNDPQ